MGSTRPEDLEHEFIVELGRVALTDMNTIFFVAARLGMDRTVIEK